DGKIFTIDPAVDAASRNVRLRAVLPERDARLRPGMFVRVTVVEPTKMSVVAIPATAIVHASFGDSVFIVEEGRDAAGQPAKAVRQQSTRLGPGGGDFVAVSEGLKAGQEVVVAGAFKLRNGAKVAVNNEVKPHPELAPHPPNR